MYNFLCQTSDKRKIIIKPPERIHIPPERIHKHFLNITSVNFDIFTNFLKQRVNQHSSFDSSNNAMTKCFCSKLNFKNCVEVIKKIVNWPIYTSHAPAKECICKIAVLFCEVFHTAASQNLDM